MTTANCQNCRDYRRDDERESCNMNKPLPIWVGEIKYHHYALPDANVCRWHKPIEHTAGPAPLFAG